MTPKIVAYTVVQEDQDSFIGIVYRHIDDGWQPLGGVSFDSSNSYMIQALVRYEENNAQLPTSSSEGVPPLS